MINQVNASILAKHMLQRKKQIANSYNSSVEKSISLEQFEKSFPASEFERYSTSAIKRFVDDYTSDLQKSESAEDVQEMLANELTGLTKITVEKGESVEDMYVRQKSAENAEEENIENN